MFPHQLGNILAAGPEALDRSGKSAVNVDCNRSRLQIAESLTEVSRNAHDQGDQVCEGKHHLILDSLRHSEQLGSTEQIVHGDRAAVEKVEQVQQGVGIFFSKLGFA
jgi:hypothetical protein